MDLLMKMESSLAQELTQEEGKKRVREHRSAGNSPVGAHRRNRSQLFDQIKID
jgi:hypothetical protein